MKSKENISWQTYTTVILGLWLIISAFLKFDSAIIEGNNFLVGFILVLVGYTMVERKTWQSWMIMLMGIWMIVVAFTPYFIVDKGYLGNNLISGIIIAFLGFGVLDKPIKRRFNFKE